MKAITLEQTAQFLKEYDKYLILMHKSPDGDTIGCGYGLCMALRSIGKKADVLCGDPVPLIYKYFTDCVSNEGFEPEYIVSVDVATTKLLSGKALEYQDSIDLCIDHHGSNTGFAKYGYVNGKTSSCAEIIKDLLDIMKVDITKDIANAVFTGICTDTGCFKYASVSPETHRAAADLMEKGAQSGYICYMMFDNKSKSKMMLEKMVLDTLEYYCDGQIAFVLTTLGMIEKSGAVESDLDGIASIPRQIEGVKIGITMKEKENGECRFSVRTSEEIDASAICSQFGGGGHKAAAGCSIHKALPDAKKDMLEACIKMLEGNV